MPTTFNGIGTRYGGQENVERRTGVCEHCSNVGELLSYDTRLWFCFLYIPVIPLSKKRIINYCSQCTMHAQLGSNQWEEVRTEAIRKAQSEFEADPKNPEKAVAWHATLDTGGEREAAESTIGILEERFADNASVQIYLGSVHEDRGRIEESNARFHRAYELNQAEPGARQASAAALLRENKPKDAKGRIDEAKRAGDPTDPALAFAIANSLHAAGESSQAAELLQELSEAIPGVRREKAFRQLAKQVEAVVGEPGSISPPRPFWSTPAFHWAAVGMLVLASLIGYELYTSSNQPLFVVNGLPTPISVRVDQNNEIDLRANGRRRVNIAEGTHQYEVTSPEELRQTGTFKIASGFTSQWFSKPLHVLDPTGSALLVREETIFSDAPAARDTEGLDFSLVYGETLHSFDHADHHFEAFPSEIEVSDTTKEVRRSRVGMQKVHPLAPMTFLPDAKNDPKMLDYLEVHLPYLEDPETALTAYTSIASEQGSGERALAFLEERLDDRPVRIHWHRMYQSLAEVAGQEDLVERYDGMLGKAPDDATLLYLRGRLEKDSALTMRYYNRAVELAPRSPIFLIGAAYSVSCVGEFEAAIDLYDRALVVEPDNARATSQRYQLLLALGFHNTLESGLRLSLRDNPLNLRDTVLLMLSLADRGAMEKMNAAAGQFRRTLRLKWPDDPLELDRQIQIEVAILSGDLDTAKREAERLQDASTKHRILFRIALLHSDLEGAVGLIPQLTTHETGDAWMLVAVAALRADDRVRHRTCLLQAEEWHGRQSGSGALVARALSDSVDDTERVDIATGVVLEPSSKAILLRIVSERAGGQREQVLRLGRLLAGTESGHRRFVLDSYDSDE